jgi:shikimate dehydrogenase
MISGRTKLLAVIGHPVSHSLSPYIQNKFLEAAGLDFAYMAFDVTRETLPAFLAAAKTLQITGFNVTMPLKEAILPFLGELDEIALACGAVNTVVSRDGALTGYNTDGEGLLLSLNGAIPDFHGKNALVLGAGGASKAVSAALRGAGASVTALSRREIHAELEKHVPDADLIVNATPLGMENHDAFSDFGILDGAKSAILVYDLVYNPRETALLREARRRGLAVAHGVSLLVCQAASSFARFTGQPAPPAAVAELLAELG